MRRTFKACLLALLVGAVAVSAGAQTATANIHGKVQNEQGKALTDAKIEAVGTASGFVKTVTAAPDGSFQLGGLTPGEYTIVGSAGTFEPRSAAVNVLVGQNLDISFVMPPTAVLNESITVSGEVLIDTRTSEAATI